MPPRATCGETSRRFAERFKSVAFIAGNPAGVARQVADIWNLGIDGVIVNMPDIHEAESVAIAGEALSNSL